ncbi:MAG: hypothetical protein BGP06_09605 [Rhizobiales bacterium 65-9]|nr:Maf family protein [Hyphomicrobiales bacterium]OJY34599.1 MAG: hypothetical protein BGP06_09605 [Rhizobiales bacterium 65-9]
MSASAWPWLLDAPLLLASGSATRAHMLEAVGLPIETRKPSTDERVIEAPLIAAGLGPADRALALARAKALSVSQDHPDRLVLGADQTLAAAGHPGVKARDRAEATAFLKGLCGAEHALHSAAVVARDGIAVFACVDSARLVMRQVSDGFIETYLDHVGDESMSSVGGYRIEGLGAQFFAHVSGEHNVILGLPLFPVLSFLRRIGALAS